MQLCTYTRALAVKKAVEELTNLPRQGTSRAVVGLILIVVCSTESIKTGVSVRRCRTTLRRGSVYVARLRGNVGLDYNNAS